MKAWVAGLLLMACSLASADYAMVLSTYVDKHGMVDYAGLKANRGPLDAYVKSLENPNTAGWTEQDWIAFWINAYNARTLQIVVDHYPVKGIKSIRGAWTRLHAPIAGKNRTLDEIEHKILRKDYDEPRIHMALVCAAWSCPKLRNEPYNGTILGSQLSDQSRAFLSRPTRFRINGNTAYLSKIFNWFKRDFESVPEFIKTYSGQDISGMKIKYQRYDWSLNEQKRREP